MANKAQIQERWMTISSLTPEGQREMLRRHNWGQGCIDKLFSISPTCPTAKRIRKQFCRCHWTPFKPRNKDYPMWEYLVLLKLVVARKLFVITDGTDSTCPNKPRGILRFAIRGD